MVVAAVQSFSKSSRFWAPPWNICEGALDDHEPAGVHVAARAAAGLVADLHRARGRCAARAGTEANGGPVVLVHQDHEVPVVGLGAEQAVLLDKVLLEDLNLW
jgi:hypothetical protein